MKNRKVNQAIRFLDSWLSYRVRHASLIGLSVTVHDNTKTVFSRHYGMADVEQKIPLGPQHLFHVASQTKMLTAVAILRFVENNKVHLDDLIISYLPWLHKHPDARYRKINIRQLLNHSSGLLRDGADSDYWLFKRQCPTKAEIRRIILESRLTFDPGHSVKYSNLNFALLGQIIEKVSGKSYKKHVNDIIVTSGIRDLALDYGVKSRVAMGYGAEFDHSRRALSNRLPAKGLVAATGLYATTDAMCHIADSLCPGNTLLLKDKSKREMLMSQSVIKSGYDQGAVFGLGLEIQSVGEQTIMGHSGHMAGHLTATYFDPDRGISVSVSANAKDTPCVNIARGIFTILNHFSATDGAQDAIGYPFSIRLRNEVSTVQVVQTKDRIIAIDPDDWEPFSWCEGLEIINDTTLKIVTPGSLYNFGETLTYAFDEKGKVASVRFAGLTMFPDI